MANLRLVFFPGVGYHIAMNEESVDDIASKLAEAVPEGLRAVRDDLEQNFRSVLRSSLNKLAALEAKLKELEQA